MVQDHQISKAKACKIVGPPVQAKSLAELAVLSARRNDAGENRTGDKDLVSGAVPGATGSYIIVEK